jgi:hypothetical protein
LANWIKKEYTTIYCLEETHLIDRKALAQGERVEEDLPSQWTSKTGRSNNNYLGQRRLQTYSDQMR